jgi:5'-deoxynucleotidase YfbR-like HD superfamily hydrolase
MELLFSAPPNDPAHTEACNQILQIGALANRLAQEKRTHITHSDGRAENVAEHTYMLCRIALHLATSLYPQLSLADVALFANLHDDLEAYVGDTPTHEETASMCESKAAREAVALQQAREDFAHIPSYIAMLTAYEEQHDPAARFVRVVDKLMPLLTNIVSGGDALVGHWSKDALLNNVHSKSKKLLEEYPEYRTIIELREELKLIAAERLYTKK